MAPTVQFMGGPEHWGAGMDAMQANLGWRWRDLPVQNRRWLLYNAVVVTAIINLIANAGIAWFSVKGQHSVPLWTTPRLGRTTTITDTVGTFFFLPLFTCLFCTTAVYQQVRSGRLARLTLESAPLSVIDRLPQRRWRRGLVMGGICTALLSPLAVPILFGADFDGVSGQTFVLYKATLGVGLGLVVTPLVALRAMLDQH